MAKASSAPWLYFKQLLVGRDIAVQPTKDVHRQTFSFAKQMANFVYLVGDATTHECIAVDPCWDIGGLISIASKDGYTIVGGVLTHYHFDHCGGTAPAPFSAYKLEGVADLVASCKGCKAYVNKLDADVVVQQTGVPEDALVRLDDEQEITIGQNLKMRFLHTPGHTPGAHCIFVEANNSIITGDTMFIGSFGRLDLKDGSPEQMYDSFNNKLAKLQDNVVVYPGHNYGSKPHSSIGAEKTTNLPFRVSKEQFVSMLSNKL